MAVTGQEKVQGKKSSRSEKTGNFVLGANGIIPMVMRCQGICSGQEKVMDFLVSRPK